MKIEDALSLAKRLGKYLVTVSVCDESKAENDLQHFTFRKEFGQDDIVPSLDSHVRALGIKPPPVPEVLKSPTPPDMGKNLKIAVITHFNRCPDSYSPGRATKHIIKMLREYGHEPVFFVVEGSTLDVGCEMRPVIPKFKREKNVIDEEGKAKIIDVLREQLTGFDLAITIDLYIDDCITYREAVKECNVPIGWLHWARSGVGRAIDFHMDNALYVFMNKADSEVFASRIGVSHDRVRLVYNEKDPALLYGWSDVTKEIVHRMRLWEKDVVQAYPICTTRMDAKGINSVIGTFGAMKRLGKKVGLIICNSNGRRRADEIKAKLKLAKECGLVDGDDIMFTSQLPDAFGTVSEVPHRTVMDLLQLSNVFILATGAEVCSNILLEASMTKNLLVLNEDLPCLFDFAGKNDVLSYPFTSSRSLHFTGRTPDELEELARKIIGQLESNKADRQFRRVWRTHNIDTVYREQLAPAVYEAEKITRGL